MDEIADRLQKGETTVEKLSAEIKSFDYYREAYGAVLDGLVGEYEIEAENEGRKCRAGTVRKCRTGTARRSRDVKRIRMTRRARGR